LTVVGPSAATDALLFELAGSRIALVAKHVIEVVRAVEIEPLPYAPAVVSGVINARGVLLPVIDMRRRLGLQTKALSPDDHFIIADCGPRQVALHVDRALDLLAIDAPALRPLAENTASPYVAGALAVEDGVLLIYDLPAFLSGAEAATLDQAMTELTVAANQQAADASTQESA
jgi:purine-binding chemotaxis protein CheW